MGKLLLVCVGGAIGSAFRHLVATWGAESFGPGLPRGTRIVNVVGSFLIAVIMEASLRTMAVSAPLRLLLTAWIMGGFTTYSSFNFVSIRLLLHLAAIVASR